MPWGLKRYYGTWTALPYLELSSRTRARQSLPAGPFPSSPGEDARAIPLCGKVNAKRAAWLQAGSRKYDLEICPGPGVGSK